MPRETSHPHSLVFQTLTQASPSPCASSSALIAFNSKQKSNQNTGGPTSATTSPLRPRPFQGDKGEKMDMAKRIEKLSEAIVQNLNKEGTLERDYRDTNAQTAQTSLNNTVEMSPQLRIVNVDRGRALPSDRYTQQDTCSSQALGATHTMDLPHTHNPFTQDLIDPDVQEYEHDNGTGNELNGREDAAFRANFHSSFDTRDEHFSPLKKESEPFNSIQGQPYLHPGVHHRSRSKNRSKFYY